MSGQIKAKPRTRATYKRFVKRLDEGELLETLREIVSRHHHVTLQDVYGNLYSPANFAARLECFWQLERIGWSANQIADLFDRHTDSVFHAMRLLRRESGIQGAIIDDDNVVRLAQAVAYKSRLARQQNGRMHAAERLNGERGPASLPEPAVDDRPIDAH